MSTSTVTERSSATAPDLLSCCLAALILVLTAFVLSPPSALFDLPEFYTAATLLLGGRGSEIYLPETFRALQEALFPGQPSAVLFLLPTTLPFLLPLALVPLPYVRAVWWLLLVSCSAAALVLLVKSYSLPPRWLVRLAACLAVFGPYWEAIKHGQVAPFLLLALATGLWALRAGKTRAAALAFALLSAKPQFLLPIVAFLIGRRRIAVVAYMVPVLAVLGGLAFVLIGEHGFENYLGLGKRAVGSLHILTPEAGPTLRGQLVRIFPQADQVVMVVSAMVLALAVAWFYALGARAGDEREQADHLAVGVLPAGIVTCLYSQSYDLVLLLPTMVALASGYFTRASLACRVILVVCLVVFSMPVYNKVHYEYLLRGGVLNPFFFALAIAAVTLACQVWRRRSGSES